jgi:hypothetical protein
METTFVFLLKVSGCLAIFYGAFLLIFRNDTNFKVQRFFLLTSIGLSVILAFNNYALRQYQPAASVESFIPAAMVQQIQPTSNLKLKNSETKISNSIPIQKKSKFTFSALLKWLYVAVTLFLFFRIIIGFIKISSLLWLSKSTVICNTRLYLTKKINGSANVFGSIFLNPSLTKDEKLSQIILHEKIHASQYHTIDILLVELLAAAMWFNPVVWFMRRSLQQIHEYLADDGVLRSGVNRLEYQELLINHIAEDSLVLSSGFKSSIKKRFFMMTKTNEPSQTKSKILTLLPLTAILIAGISFINAPAQEKQPVKQTTQVKFEAPQTSTNKSSIAIAAKTANPPQEKIKIEPPLIEEETETPQEPPIAAISLDAMNVLYLGVDNPLTVAVSNHDPNSIKLSTNNGSIIRSGNKYIARPASIGISTISIFAGDKLLSRSDYRVKRIPDPVAKVGGKKGGLAKKDFLLSEDEIIVDMENFDFNLKFTVTEFTLSTVQGGFSTDIDSKSNKITQAQKNLISQASKDQKIYFIDIKCVGPDGGVRELPPMLFQIL